ncbi:MAG: hypothetical protein ACTS6J_23815 [Burkholderiales bacterium]
MHADAAALLALWESALGQPALARDDALLRVSFDATARTLGERNARLIELHARLFGREVALLSHCPSCGTVAQFGADCDALAAAMPVAAEVQSQRLEVQGHLIEFRLPDSADVAAAAGEKAGDEFAQHMLERCVLSCTFGSESVSVRQIPVAVLDALSQRMETLDPCASVSFALACPECATRWDARLDVGQMVWQKVQAAAERLLLEVDALARSYGWTESEVLGLSSQRRAAYLQMAAA